jgi:hypothetical protein
MIRLSSEERVKNDEIVKGEIAATEVIAPAFLRNDLLVNRL